MRLYRLRNFVRPSSHQYAVSVCSMRYVWTTVTYSSHQLSWASLSWFDSCKRTHARTHVETTVILYRPMLVYGKEGIYIVRLVASLCAQSHRVVTFWCSVTFCHLVCGTSHCISVCNVTLRQCAQCHTVSVCAMSHSVSMRNVALSQCAQCHIVSVCAVSHCVSVCNVTLCQCAQCHNVSLWRNVILCRCVRYVTLRYCVRNVALCHCACNVTCHCVRNVTLCPCVCVCVCVCVRARARARGWVWVCTT
jgi:hypothetical protein